MRRWITASEVRLALRLIAKQPVLSITIILALATGVCLATIGFTLREAILNGHLPFANGDRFVRLVLHSEADDNVELDLDAYHAIRDTSNSFAYLGAMGDGEYALESEDGTVEAIRVGLVTPRSFQFLPAVPMIGRVLIPADGEPGAEPVVVVRESLWRRRFGASASIVGQPIQLSGLTRTVVGILPDTFKFPSAGEIWVPLDEATLAGRASQSGGLMTVFGILRDGLDQDGATAELTAYARPERRGKPGTATSVLALPFTGDDDTTNTVMSGLVAVLVLVLLVVASNIASLVIARTWSRSSELAVRTALGAGRSRVVGQLFVEVAILGAIASVLGLGFAQVALNYMVGMISDIPFWMTFDPTVRTMVFVVALTLLVSVVSGLGPALRVTSVNLTGALHAQGRGSAAGGFGGGGCALGSAAELRHRDGARVGVVHRRHSRTAERPSTDGAAERRGIEGNPRSPAGRDSHVSRSRVGRRCEPFASSRSHRDANRDRIAQQPVARAERLGSSDRSGRWFSREHRRPDAGGPAIHGQRLPDWRRAGGDRQSAIRRSFLPQPIARWPARETADARFGRIGAVARNHWRGAGPRHERR